MGKICYEYAENEKYNKNDHEAYNTKCLRFYYYRTAESTICNCVRAFVVYLSGVYNGLVLLSMDVTFDGVICNLQQPKNKANTIIIQQCSIKIITIISETTVICGSKIYPQN